MSCVSEGDRFLPPRIFHCHPRYSPKIRKQKKTQAPAEKSAGAKFFERSPVRPCRGGACPVRWVTMSERQKSTLRLPGQRKSLPLCRGVSVLLREAFPWGKVVRPKPDRMRGGRHLWFAPSLASLLEAYASPFLRMKLGASGRAAAPTALRRELVRNSPYCLFSASQAR